MKVFLINKMPSLWARALLCTVILAKVAYTLAMRTLLGLVAVLGCLTGVLRTTRHCAASAPVVAR